MKNWEKKLKESAIYTAKVDIHIDGDIYIDDGKGKMWRIGELTHMDKQDSDDGWKRIVKHAKPSKD